MKTIEAVATTSAPREAVWALLEDAPTWAEWGMWSSVEVEGGGDQRAGALRVLLDDVVHAEGAVGAIVSGLPILAVVSQGCRPLGREAVITRCEGNVVYELAGRPAVERLREEVAAERSRPAGSSRGS
ncbi:MAG: FIST N-terminal domain-containing protein [Gaiellaceae bacterium]